MFSVYLRVASGSRIVYFAAPYSKIYQIAICMNTV